MRTKNSLYNAATGMGYDLARLVLSFVTRTFFIYYLGKSYLGLNGLFTNVISLLNLTELGFGNAIVYSLYQPLANRDYPKIQSLMRFFQKAFRIIGGVVLVLGLCLVPFLPKIVNLPDVDINITRIYLLFLANSVCSYWFFAYRRNLLMADQKRYIISFYTGVFLVFSNILQILAIVLWRAYLLTLAVQLATTILTNVFISRRVARDYPYIRAQSTHSLPPEERRDIFKNVYALGFYKISGTVLTSTDNIVISACIGTQTVGVFSNYQLIASFLRNFLSFFFSSFTAGIGNLNVTENVEKKHFIFKCLHFLNFWLYGLFSICFCLLINPFVRLWAGNAYLLDGGVAFIMALNYVTEGLEDVVIRYKDACGLFWHGKYRAAASAVFNVALSLALVRPLGILGVVLATVISRLLTTWWFDPWMVHKYVFNRSPVKYYLRYILYFVVIAGAGVITRWLCGWVPGAGWPHLLGMAAVCLAAPNLIFFALFGRTQEFRFVLGRLKAFFQNRFGPKTDA